MLILKEEQIKVVQVLSLCSLKLSYTIFPSLSFPYILPLERVRVYSFYQFVTRKKSTPPKSPDLRGLVPSFFRPGHAHSVPIQPQPLFSSIL